MADAAGVAVVGACTGLAADDQIVMNNGDVDMCLERLTGPIGLDPGDRAVVYFKVINGTLNPIDAGISTSVNIFAGKTGAPLSLTVQNP
jgi:hypothetical protein